MESTGKIKLEKLGEQLLDTGKGNNLVSFRHTATTVEVVKPDWTGLLGRLEPGTHSFKMVVPGGKYEETKETVAAEENVTVSGPEDTEETTDIPPDETVPDVEKNVEATDGTEPDGNEVSGSTDETTGISEVNTEESNDAENDGSVEDTAVPGAGTPDTGTPENTAADQADARPRRREAYILKYGASIRDDKRFLVYSHKKGPVLTAVRDLDRKAKALLEETGVNSLYMAVGFIHWKEEGNRAPEYQAPVLLLPVAMERIYNSECPYRIETDRDEMVLNPVFAYKLNAEYGISLPEYRGEDPDTYLDIVAGAVSGPGWTVSRECVLGIFSFLKINMYHDLMDNAGAVLENFNVRRILNEPADEAEGVCAAAENGEKSELLIVADADSSQIDAIEMARSGESFVLQGPPGTGKSQTITNIIAALLYLGKKVLFVSEKKAALDVVYSNLKKAGLADSCLELHSHKANKKEFITDLCSTLRGPRSAVAASAETEKAARDRSEKQLEDYFLAVHGKRPVIDKSLYELYEEYSAVSDSPDVIWSSSKAETKGSEHLEEMTSLLEQYAEHVPFIGEDYRQNPWYGFTGTDITAAAKHKLEQELKDVCADVRAMIPLMEDISGRYGIADGSLKSVADYAKLFRLASTMKTATMKLLNRSRLKKVMTAEKKLRAKSYDVLFEKTAIDGSFREGIYDIDGAELLSRFRNEFGSIANRILNPAYRQMITKLKECSRDGVRPGYESAVRTAELLALYQKDCADFAETEAPVLRYLGPGYAGVMTDWDRLEKELDGIKDLLKTGICFGNLADLEDIETERKTMTSLARKFRKASAAADSAAVKSLSASFDGRILDIRGMPCYALPERLEACAAAMDSLENWCAFRNLLDRLKELGTASFLNEAIDQKVDPEKMAGAYAKLFLSGWIDSVTADTPMLSVFGRISHDKAVEVFREKDRELLEINKAKIRARLSAMRPSDKMVSPGSQLALILREGEKRRRQKSIRALLSEAGEAIQRIKPCFLMSPLSVSTYLVPGSADFDTVIFDEASQVFPQDALGAIYRANQVIVVGDSRQMPPTNFFNAVTGDGDTDDGADGVTDFESILDLCSACMKKVSLRWHYRSRYEQLISFSNDNFYGGTLVTFPSCRTDAPGIGVDYIHADGVYDRKTRTNLAEAEQVADLVYRNIEVYPDRSLGVVAFSVAQQELIESILQKRRDTEPEKEYFFTGDVKEPFFVKNLETVQGDERDTIIFSVAYGKDENGKLLQNFGPLNKAGGERRLNVAVTRARCNVQLVSSMRYTDIDLSRSSSEGVRLLRDYLEYAEKGAAVCGDNAGSTADEHETAALESEICAFLRSHGYETDENVGCSGMKIDLAVKRPGGTDYVVAVECDGRNYLNAGNTRDRDRLRQEILERMGWRYYRVWSADWIRNKTTEQERLLEEVKAAMDDTEPDPGPVPDIPSPGFETEHVPEDAEFPVYEEADLNAVFAEHEDDLKAAVRAVLETEAPLSEELLLRRMTAGKPAGAVRREYESRMYGCQGFGIFRRNGFLYLEDAGPAVFRRAGDVPRDIVMIAPEELAAGMLRLVRANGTVEKKALYRMMAEMCGTGRPGPADTASLDGALALLEGYVITDGEYVSPV